MGCGCGGGGTASAPRAGSAQNFMLVHPDGKKEYYPTETAARAANAKNGGKALLKRVK